MSWKSWLESSSSSMLSKQILYGKLRYETIEERELQSDEVQKSRKSNVLPFAAPAGECMSVRDNRERR